jgi:hypothetical protein
MLPVQMVYHVDIRKHPTAKSTATEPIGLVRGFSQFERRSITKIYLGPSQGTKCRPIHSNGGNCFDAEGCRPYMVGERCPLSLRR